MLLMMGQCPIHHTASMASSSLCSNDGFVIITAFSNSILSFESGINATWYYLTGCIDFFPSLIPLTFLPYEI